LDGQVEGAIELIVAVFRLAVADYFGHSYSFDICAPIRRTSNRHRSNAAEFLSGVQARYLADQIGLDASSIWREVRRLEQWSMVEKQALPAA
jgi:hypothetical protein